MASHAALGALAIASLGCLRGAWAEGSASVGLGREELGIVLDLEPGASSRMGLSLDAEAESARLRAFLELGLGEGGQAALSIGPASPEGCLRFILDPLSAAALSAARPLRIDRSMESGRGAISVGTGGLRAFAIAAGGGSPFSFGVAGAGPDAPAGSLRFDAAVLGAAARGSLAGISWAAAIDASSRPPDAGSEGWKPERAPDGGGRIAHTAFLARRGLGAASASAALALSAGELEAPSLAAKLQAERRIGPVSLNASVGAAGAGYRGLFGDFPDELFLLSCGARMALRGAASLSLSRRLAAERSGALGAPGWRGSSAASFSTALGEGRELRLSGEIEAASRGRIFLDLSRRAALTAAAGAPGGAARSALGLRYRWESPGAASPDDGLELVVELSRSFGRRRPELDLRSSLSFPLAGERAFPIGRGRLSMRFPAGAGRELSASLSLPEGGVELGPLLDSGEGGGVELSIGYRVPLGAR